MIGELAAIAEPDRDDYQANEVITSFDWLLHSIPSLGVFLQLALYILNSKQMSLTMSLLTMLLTMLAILLLWF